MAGYGSELSRLVDELNRSTTAAKTGDSASVDRVLALAVQRAQGRVERALTGQVTPVQELNFLALSRHGDVDGLPHNSRRRPPQDLWLAGLHGPDESSPAVSDAIRAPRNTCNRRV